MSNNPNDPHRNLKSNLNNPNQNPYSNPPPHLTLPSELQTNAGIPNPYQYGYVPSPHDPTAFAFPTHTGYRSQLQTHYTPQPPHFQQPSPTNTRKRRASELGDPSIPGSSGSSASAYTTPTGLVSGATELGGLDPTAPSQQQQPSPTVKKGRTNTPWTPAEEQRLKTLREAGSSWSEIAKTFPTRTEGSVKKHWYKDMHYAEFAEDEVSSFSAALLQAIKDYENNKWKVIGQKVGKPAKACEQFAKEQGWKI